MGEQSVSCYDNNNSWLLFIGTIIGHITWSTYIFGCIGWLPNIPIQESTSLLGFIKFTNEREVAKLVKEKGPLVQFSVMNRKFLFIADKELARAVLRDVTGKGYFHNATPRIVANSTFSIDTGPEWSLRRSSFRKAFSTTCLKAHMTTIARVNQELCARLDKAATSNSIIRIDDIFQQLTIGIICEVAFEMTIDTFADADGFGRQVDQALKDLLGQGWVRRLPLAEYLYYLPFNPFKRYRQTRLRFRTAMKILYDHIRSLKANNRLKPDGLAAAMLNFANLPGITEQQVLQEIGTFYIAGMDTTAHTLSFTIYCLARYPEVQQRSQAAVDAMLANTTLDACAGSLPPYLEAVLKESMRRFPTAQPGSLREVKQPDGYKLTENIHIPQGWWIAVNLLCLHTYEGNWGSDAFEFKPERFMCADANDPNSQVSTATIDPLDAKQTTNFASAAAYGGVGSTPNELCFAPFSFGPRNCVGMNLALMELRTTLLTLVSRFHFELGDATMFDEWQMTETVFTMRPRKGLPIRVSRR